MRPTLLCHHYSEALALIRGALAAGNWQVMLYWHALKESYQTGRDCGFILNLQCVFGIICYLG
jgi:hypothetical protein